MGKPAGRVSGNERVNTTLSGSGGGDDIKGHSQGERRGQTKVVKIREDVRNYAAEQRVDEEKAFQSRMREKAKQFAVHGVEIYGNG